MIGNCAVADVGLYMAFPFLTASIPGILSISRVSLISGGLIVFVRMVHLPPPLELLHQLQVEAIRVIVVGGVRHGVHRVLE